jgi:hypothetical protein
VRAVLDPDVISGGLSPRGVSADVLRSLTRGEFELIASRVLLDELQRVLAQATPTHQRVRRRRLGAVGRQCCQRLVVDLDIYPPVRSRDPDDDYLIASHRHIAQRWYRVTRTFSPLRRRSPCSHHAPSSSYLPRDTHEAWIRNKDAISATATR